jgi:hypothetical protein
LRRLRQRDGPGADAGGARGGARRGHHQGRGQHGRSAGPRRHRKRQEQLPADQVIDAYARAYARHFTESELKDLLLFYKTPLGQKFTREEPGAIEEGLKGAQDWGDAFSETVMARVRADMRKKGHNL